MLQTKEEAIQALKALDDALSKVKVSEKINLFDAVGMSTQEIKHSAFFAWLLNPVAPHDLKNAFLADFLTALWEYPPQDDSPQIPSNREILSLNDFDFFLNADDIKVETEKTLSGPESRIDIFIRSQSTNTVIVIENKVFTSTHNDQLARYEKEVEIFDGKKIFVYLTPKGDIPTDIDGNYQQGWCIFSYERLLGMLKKRLRSLPAGKQFYRLRFLLEDYIEMVDTTLLKNNPELRSMCKEILRKHADAIELLTSYTDNVTDIFAYIANEWIPTHIHNLARVEYRGRNLLFYTKPIADFYARHNQLIEFSPNQWAFQANLLSKDGPISVAMGLGKPAEDDWTEADVTLRNLLDPDKKMGNRCCTLYTVELLRTEERQCKFEEIKGQIDDRLAVFLKKFNELEAKLTALLNS